MVQIIQDMRYVFDLSFDPDRIIDLDFTEINKMIQSGSRRLPIKNIRLIKLCLYAQANFLQKIITLILLMMSYRGALTLLNLIKIFLQVSRQWKIGS